MARCTGIPAFTSTPPTHIRRKLIATDPAVLHFLRTKQPLKGGPGSPEECAEAAVFLCSDEARLLTGVVLPVDGGWCVSEGQWDSGRPDAHRPGS